MSYRADKQVIDPHTLTDTQTGAMTIPEGQNWPRVKMAVYNVNIYMLISYLSITESPICADVIKYRDSRV